MLADPRSRGFTLIEILIVVAIVAVLTAIALPALRGTRERTAAARARAELALVAQALENYRRLYGDYPQTGDFASAAPDTAQPLSPAHAQARVFNALTGIFGPQAFAPGDRLNGCAFLDVAKLVLESPRGGNLPAGADGRAQKEEICTSLLDPWGRRYLYYYKPASNPSAWRAAGYLLYSAGRDGLHAPPDAASGISPEDSSAVGINADNIQAEALMR